MDDGLKQRLIGAIVLGAIAVLFLPSLFKQDSRRAVDMTSQVPPEPVVVTELFEVPKPVQPDNIPPAKPLEENYPHEVVEPGPPDSTDIGSLDPPSPTETPAPVDRGGGSSSRDQPEPPVLNDDGVPYAWSLQVASFQSSERADAILERLENEGYTSYIREANSAQGPLFRVFVGPKVNKAQVEALKRSIDAQFDTDALIVEFKP
ncbi:MAG: SPOR domain-containing protein [Cellvibrionaceae bacterium]